MRDREFLEQLQEALKNDLSEQAVQENVQYYRNYIEEERAKGRTEQEILEELGDPWLIAKTLVTSPGGSQSYAEAESGYVQEGQSASGQKTQVHVFGLDTWWKKLILILAVVGIFMLIVSIVTGIISILLPIAVPFLVIAFVIRLFSNRK